MLGFPSLPLGKCKFHALLVHNWGNNNNNGSKSKYRQRVMAVNEGLRKRNLVTKVNHDGKGVENCDDVENACVVVVFVTRSQIETSPVVGFNLFKTEFHHTVISTRDMQVVLLDSSNRPQTNHLYVDMTDNNDPSDHAIDCLYEKIKAKISPTPTTTTTTHNNSKNKKNNQNNQNNNNNSFVTNMVVLSNMNDTSVFEENLNTNSALRAFGASMNGLAELINTFAKNAFSNGGNNNSNNSNSSNATFSTNCSTSFSSSSGSTTFTATATLTANPKTANSTNSTTANSTAKSSSAAKNSTGTKTNQNQNSSSATATTTTTKSQQQQQKQQQKQHQSQQQQQAQTLAEETANNSSLNAKTTPPLKSTVVRPPKLPKAPVTAPKNSLELFSFLLSLDINATSAAEYSETLFNHGFERARVLEYLDIEDAVEMGIKKGHARVIMHAAKATDWKTVSLI